MDDIVQSILELKSYREHLFRGSSSSLRLSTALGG